jgi:hypothetical protein
MAASANIATTIHTRFIMLSFQEQGGLAPIRKSYRRSEMQKPAQPSKISLTLPLWNLQTYHFGKWSGSGWVY